MNTVGGKVAAGLFVCFNMCSWLKIGVSRTIGWSSTLVWTEISQL